MLHPPLLSVPTADEICQRQCYWRALRYNVQIHAFVMVAEDLVIVMQALILHKPCLLAVIIPLSKLFNTHTVALIRYVFLM